MRVIELTRGQVAIVDDIDFEHMAQWRWRLSQAGYAVRNRRKFEGPGSKYVFMHRVILPVTDGMEVDHINGNPADNRRDNLRLVTHAQNCMNQCINKRNKLGMKGVTFNKYAKKFKARINVGGKEIHLGYFKTAEEAKAAYDAAAPVHHGEFHRLN